MGLENPEDRAEAEGSRGRLRRSSETLLVLWRKRDKLPAAHGPHDHEPHPRLWSPRGERSPEVPDGGCHVPINVGACPAVATSPKNMTATAIFGTGSGPNASFHFRLE